MTVDTFIEPDSCFQLMSPHSGHLIRHGAHRAEVFKLGERTSGKRRSETIVLNATNDGEEEWRMKQMQSEIKSI